jgi:acyl carrier protein
MRPRVVLVTDPSFGDDAIVRCSEAAAAALPAGAFCVQLRDKRRAVGSLRLMAWRLRIATQKAGGLLVLNGDARLARDVGADGVHLGGGAAAVAEARAILGRPGWISVAAHTDDDVRRATGEGADAVLVSPVFATRPPSSSGCRASSASSPLEKRPRGLEALRSARAIACVRVPTRGPRVSLCCGLCSRATSPASWRERSMTCSRRAGNVSPMASYKEALEITSELLQRRAAGDKPREIKASDRIQEDLGLDSLALMELASDVESRFGVSIPSEMYDRIQTVDDLARAVLALEGSVTG